MLVHKHNDRQRTENQCCVAIEIHVLFFLATRTSVVRLFDALAPEHVHTRLAPRHISVSMPLRMCIRNIYTRQIEKVDVNFSFNKHIIIADGIWRRASVAAPHQHMYARNNPLSWTTTPFRLTTQLNTSTNLRINTMCTSKLMVDWWVWIDCRGKWGTMVSWLPPRQPHALSIFFVLHSHFACLIDYRWAEVQRLIHVISRSKIAISYWKDFIVRLRCRDWN